MQSFSGPALVLKRSRHNEVDVRLMLFSRENGKILISSRGGMRLNARLKSLQEPFSLIDAHYYLPVQKPYGRLSGGQLIDSHPRLRSRPVAFALAARCCETVDVLLPARAPSPDVFDILRAALQSIETSAVPSIDWVWFVVKLMATLGHGDQTEAVRQIIDESPPSTDHVQRCVAFANAELQRILPWPLKSEFIELL